VVIIGGVFASKYLPEHMKGIACQTTFNAAQNGRHGGMYYINVDGLSVGPKKLLENLQDRIEVVDGVKIIRNVCVEACREGMQIYNSP